MQGVGKIEDIFGLPDPDKEAFALQLANWHPDRRNKVEVELGVTVEIIQLVDCECILVQA